MICLIEGADRCGKSTLAARLQTDLPSFKTIHFGVPDLPDAYEFFIQELREIQGEDVIVNRLHWSNHAYNGILGGPVLTDFDFWRIDAWIAQQLCVALLLVDEPHAIFDRLNEERLAAPDRPCLSSPREIGEVQTRFHRCFERSAIGLKWSLGLDQLLGVEDGESTETYGRLLRLLRGEEITE